MPSKVSLKIEIRDQRLAGGRLALSARTTSKVERRRREAVLRALLDQGHLDILEDLRARRLHIADVQRAVEAGDVDRLRAVRQEELTVGAMAKALLQKVEATKRPGTVAVYRSYLSAIEEHFGTNTPLLDVTTAMVEAYLHAPKEVYDRPWSANTQATVKMVGGRLWSLAIAREAEAADRAGAKPRLRRNPWSKAETPDQEATRAAFLLPEEWATLERTLAGRPELAFVACGCLAGLRIGEARHLRPGIDVDLDARLIRIQARDGAHAWKPKTKRSVRDVPINDRLLVILTDHARRGYAGDRFLFHPPHADRPLAYDTAMDWTERAFVAAGIRYGRKADALTNHNLRHTFASWLAQRGVSVLVIAKLLGDTVDMVIKTYAHLMPENLAEA
ncbi:MAG TPA: tyrosine-type recombinase/integrase, partial [Longimicrobiaceae bacterium]|nr:tyrosine-type recombinase/integrase [Longimicrobiaceae bacterium]